MLQRALPLLILGFTALIMVVYLQQVRRVKDSAFERLVLDARQQATTRLDRFLEPVDTNLAITSSWLQEEAPEPDDIGKLNVRLIPILQEIPQVASILIADKNGAEYMLRRSDGGWLTRLRDSGGSEAGFSWVRWTEPRRSVEEWSEASEYDPRNRPWFRGAVDSTTADASFWTPPYRFFSSGQPGITVARRISLQGGEGSYLVVAFDLLLTDISTITRSLAGEENGRAFALTADGLVVGVPQDPQFDSPAAIQASMLVPLQEFSVPVVRDAYAAWNEEGRPSAEPFQYRDDSEDWWASLWRYDLGNQSLWLGVALPEAQLVQRLGGPWYGIPVSILATGLLLFLASLAIARKTGGGGYGPGRQIPGADSVFEYGGSGGEEPAESLSLLIDEGESELLEFKSSLRWNFKAGRTGKEIELAWLKTVAAFLNSNGGVILLGVDDNGQVLGLGHDGFANDDAILRHVENLVARHLGSVHFPCIRSRLLSVADKKVLAIRCSIAARPVFLKQGDGEEFYIRTGPASRALNPSEVLSYLETRKH